MSGSMNNPLLAEAEQKIEAGLEPATRQAYMQVVVAGLHAALDKGPNGILASLRLSKDPVADAAKGAVSLVLVLRKEAKGVMPLKALVPAALTLMMKALDFADRAGMVKIAEPELVRATHILTDTIFARFGITKAGLQAAAQRVHAITQDPQAMSAVNLKAGVTRHPMAATPTPLPPSGTPGMINGAGGTS
jgi:hypothetical protein